MILLIINVIFFMLIGFISVLFLYHLYEQLESKRVRKLTQDVPGPVALPILGSSLIFGRNSVEHLKIMQKLVVDYGPIVKLSRGSVFGFLLADAKDIEILDLTLKKLSQMAVRGSSETTSIANSKTRYYLNSLPLMLSSNFKKPGEWYPSCERRPAGEQEAVKWKVHRRILTPAFHFKILETYVDIFNENANILMDLLGKEVNKGSFDISHYIDNCTLDIIFESAMTTKINAQLGGESGIPRAMKEASDAISIRAFRPWLYPDIMFKFSTLGKNYKKNVDFINRFIDKAIIQRKEDFADINNVRYLDQGEEDAEYYGTKKRLVFMDLLLSYAQDPRNPINDSDIRDEVNTFIFAGHDTTSSTLGFAIYMLGSHPDVQSKVYEELESVFGDSNRVPTYQDLTGLKYLEQVIKETLRLYPAVPLIGRLLYEDLTLSSGQVLPAGTWISLFFYMMHRDPRVFPDPERFNPDNFLPERAVGRPAYAYAPFSAGLRNCIGQRFAMLEMKVILSRLVRSFKITAMSPEPLLATQLILRSETGINLKLERRTEPH